MHGADGASTGDDQSQFEESDGELGRRTLRVLQEPIDPAPLASNRPPWRWATAYASADVEQFVHAFHRECARLEAAIAEARHRAERARSEPPAPVQAEVTLGTLLLAAQRELEQLEHDHRLTLDAIHDAAVAQARRLVEAARADASSVSAAALSLESLRRPGDL